MSTNSRSAGNQTPSSRFVDIVATIRPTPVSGTALPIPADRTEDSAAGAPAFAAHALTAPAAAAIIPWFQSFTKMQKAAFTFNPHLPGNLRTFGQSRIGLIFPTGGDPTAEANFASACTAQGLDTSNLDTGFSSDLSQTFLDLGALLDSGGQTVDRTLTAIVKEGIDSQRQVNPNDPHLNALHWLQVDAISPLLVADVLTPGLQTLLQQNIFLQLPTDFQAGLTMPFQQTARSFTELYDQILGR